VKPGAAVGGAGQAVSRSNAEAWAIACCGAASGRWRRSGEDGDMQCAMPSRIRQIGCANGTRPHRWVTIAASCSLSSEFSTSRIQGEAMNKKFLIAWILIFLAWMLGSFVVHGVLLHDDYLQLSTLFRTEADAQQYFPWMILAHVLLSGAFVWIYAQGVQNKPWLAQGVRFGIAVALLTIVPTYMIYYAVQPMPGMVVVKQMLFDGVLTVLLGLIVAAVYRQQA
jgi:hypothetical protein